MRNNLADGPKPILLSHFLSVLGGLLLLPTLALAKYPGSNAAWDLAEPLTRINTEAGEGCPIETRDGLSLMFASTRSGGAGGLDIWVADRESIDAPWQTPRNLPMPVNSSAADLCPTPVLGRALLFVSDRPAAGVCGGGDMYLSRQSPAGDWSAPRLLGCAPSGPNSSGPERSPALIETRRGTLLFYSSTGGGTGHDIYMSRQHQDGSFGPGHIVADLSSDADDFMPNIRRMQNGWYEVVFNSNRLYWGRHADRPAFGGQDVYTALSRQPHRWWSTPHNLGENVNTDGNESRATLSADGQRLVFGRNGDLYTSQRSKERH